MPEVNEISQDVRIRRVDSLSTPDEIRSEYPMSVEAKERVESYRKAVNDILLKKDDRLLAIVGPCSIHDPASAIEYAKRLKELSDRVKDRLFIVMRAYFEKPRTTVGWKGLITDPFMDHTDNIDAGLRIGRKLLLDITDIGLPVGCEFLDPIVPQYIDEIMCWASIGARTSESQTHRSLASGLSVAVGFKNSTSGEIEAAINACLSANSPASFIGVKRDGRCAIFRSTGNNMAHLILRGGVHGPNYYEDFVDYAAKSMEKANLNPAIIIDCSHSNSSKDYTKQKRVLRNIIDQVIYGSKNIRGFMLESNLFEGNQAIKSKEELKYGVSVTDACIGFDETERIILKSAELLRKGIDDKELI